MHLYTVTKAAKHADDDGKLWDCLEYKPANTFQENTVTTGYSKVWEVRKWMDNAPPKLDPVPETFATPTTEDNEDQFEDMTTNKTRTLFEEQGIGDIKIAPTSMEGMKWRLVFD